MKIEKLLKDEIIDKNSKRPKEKISHTLTLKHLDSSPKTNKQWSEGKEIALKELIDKAYTKKTNKNIEINTIDSNVNQRSFKEQLIPIVFEEFGVSSEEFKKLEQTEEFGALSPEKRLFVAEQLEQLVLSEAHKKAKEQDNIDTENKGSLKKIFRSVGKKNRIKKLEDVSMKDIISRDEDMYGDALAKFIKDTASGPDIEFNFEKKALFVTDTVGEKHLASEYIQKEMKKATETMIEKEGIKKEEERKKRKKENQKMAVEKVEKENERKLAEKEQIEIDRIEEAKRTEAQKKEEDYIKLAKRAEQENERIEKAKKQEAERNKETDRETREVVKNKIRAEEWEEKKRLREEKIQEKEAHGAQKESVQKKEVEKELNEISEEKREKIGIGIANLGFFVEEGKNNFFAGISKSALGLVDKKGTMGRFLLSLNENFTRDAKQARENIEKVEKGEKKKLSNVGYLAANVLKYGRVVTDVVGSTLASPIRYAMMGGMFFARGAEAAKEARLKNEEIIEKTRINDIDEAANEAWRIYEEAVGENGSISKDELEKAYQKNVPQDLMKRLQKNPEPGVGSGIIQRVINKDVGLLVKRIDGKIRKIEEDSDLSDDEKKLKVEKIINKYSKHLESLDRMVSRYGAVDALAMGAKYAETGAKAVVAGMMVETLTLSIEKIWGNLADVLGDSDALTISEATSDLDESVEVPIITDETLQEKLDDTEMPLTLHETSSTLERSVDTVSESPLQEKIIESNNAHSVIEKGGNIWNSAKEIVKDPNEFSEAWKNSMINLPGQEESIHISEVNLVRPGTIVEYIPGEAGEAGHFEIKVPEGQRLSSVGEQEVFTEKINVGETVFSSKEIAVLADNVFQNDLDSMYGVEGFSGHSGEKSIEWLDLKNKPVLDVLNKNNFESDFLKDNKLASKEAIGKMQNYLKQLIEKSSLNPTASETTEEFIKRAGIKINS